VYSHLDKIDDKIIAELEGLLSRFSSSEAMDLEQMDGFFAALHCCPDMIPPSEYLSQIWGGGEMPSEESFEDEEQANLFFSAVMNHWNNVGDRLNKDKVFLPLIDDETEFLAERWAQGFLQGMSYAQGDWADLLNDEENGGSAVVVFALAHQNDPDPEMRPFEEPVSVKKREDLLVHLAASASKIHQYFEGQRHFNATLAKESGVIKRSSPKVGRNAPCPCGSGKKYKKCCFSNSLH
jgi:uncharacterized protein